MSIKKLDNKKLKRLIDRDEATRMMIDYYEGDDVIELYLYNFISTILLSHEEQKEKINDVYFDEYIMDIVSNVSEYEDIYITSNDLKKDLSILNEIKVSDNLFELLLNAYSLNEDLIKAKFDLNENLNNRLYKEKYETLENMKKDYMNNLKNNYYEKLDNNHKTL